MLKKQWVLDVQDADIDINALREIWTEISNGSLITFYPLEVEYNEISEVERDIMGALFENPEFEEEYYTAYNNEHASLIVLIKVWW